MRGDDVSVTGCRTFVLNDIIVIVVFNFIAFTY